MDRKQSQLGQGGNLTRRDFMRDSAVAAAALAAALGSTGCQSGQKDGVSVEKTRSYNPNMEYRRLGKTPLMLSAVSLGGHWKRLVPRFGTDKFKKNRRDVVSACIESGINYVDACTSSEIIAYSEALRGRREQMYFGFSYCEHEARHKEWQTKAKLLEALDDIMGRSKLDYADFWRITCLWKPDTDHSAAHEEAIVGALEHAKKAGKVRFSGISTHKHDWAIRMIETYPDTIEGLVVPYTAGSKKGHMRVDPKGGSWQGVAEKKDAEKPNTYSLIDAVKKAKVGWVGIKPFASGSVFKSRGKPDSATREEDDRRARLTLRYILSNEALTCAIPGLITPEQVRNAAKAVGERRRLDMAESQQLQQAVDEMWANLPASYRWLEHEWKWV